ncbi:Uncharacterised protein, partial [Mycoplasma putrefaciens]
MFLLNFSASLNILSRFSTFEVFHIEISPLNALAPQKTPSRDVTFEVSQARYLSLLTNFTCLVLMFWLNIFAFLNNW